MGFDRRLRRLEAAQDTDPPEAAAVYTNEGVVAYIYATGEQLPLAKYERRWPNHPTLKCYLGWRLIEAA